MIRKNVLLQKGRKKDQKKEKNPKKQKKKKPHSFPLGFLK